ncbi:adenosine kinase [Coraliomargarita parva]|uniref:adenosine kinase n=1 Tax=Coraliomargarita parva TaxID=3014050 RepID=UPI0022B56889|nr:adenosine kinase [Coraliomargarita parva]
MSQVYKIIGVGSPIVDAIAIVPDEFLGRIEGGKGGMVYVSPETMDSIIEELPQPPVRTPGGSSGNTLFTLARLGAAAGFIGKTGNCGYGSFYRDSFVQLGGDHSGFKIGDVPNGRCLSLVTPDGERTMRTDLGAAMTLNPEEVTPEDFAGYTHAHIEGYLLFNEALMRRVLECAKTAGCTISLDLASYEVVGAAGEVLSEILESHVDLVFANEEEAEAFTGIKGDYAAMATSLAKLCRIAAVKVGPEGSYVAEGDRIVKIAPVPAKQVIDTTAAGDLWAAGFLYGWSRGLDLLECGALASLLGSAAVEVHGSVLADSIYSEILQANSVSP